MLHYFFVNPTAGNIKQEEYVPVIEKVCKARNIEYVIDVSKYKGYIIEKAQEIGNANDEITIYSIGGDGTFYESVNGVMKSSNPNVILVPIPCGSGNDFVRTFGYQVKEEFEVVLNRALDYSVKEIDVMKINDQYGANISSVGFDANVVVNAIKFKKLWFVPNKMAYTYSVFYTFITQGSYKVKLSLDGEELPYKVILLACAANGQYYGGGMQPVPSAVIDDGLLDVCIAEKVNKLRIAKFFPLYKKGRATELPVAHLLKGKKLEVISEKELPINIDGEVISGNSVSFEICDRKLKIGVLKID